MFRCTVSQCRIKDIICWGSGGVFRWFKIACVMALSGIARRGKILGDERVILSSFRFVQREGRLQRAAAVCVVGVALFRLLFSNCRGVFLVAREGGVRACVAAKWWHDRFS